jgi:diacylglycerol O-acyltransferase
MNDTASPPAAMRLSGEDLTFWWADSPMQPTTMAMMLLLDRVPDEARLRRAFERAVASVPRLRQRVVDAPLGLTLPHWAFDPTFDLDYHVRRHAVAGTHDLDELFREVSSAYETPFDRSRPLWEARLYEGLAGERAALFFKLHHAIADGVGANAIFAAMTDWERDGDGPPPETLPDGKGAWEAEPPLARRVADALRDRVELDLERARAVGRVVLGTVLHPSRIPQALAALRSFGQAVRFDSHSPLRDFGRARRLAGVDLPFDGVRSIRRALDGRMIDVILTIMARAIGKWHRVHEMTEVRELMTLVPVNLRKPEEWVDAAAVGNVATGLLVALPIGLHHPVATFREVHRRVEEKKADPAAGATPMLADILSVLGHQFVSWMGEVTFGAVNFIVTNVPGILATRYLAGTEIVAAYPFAPVALKSPASVALYGYRDRLFIGIDADLATMPDVDDFKAMVVEAYEELAAAATNRMWRAGGPGSRAA